MKNLNLIKRLWTDSHEKQSPQRFGRYAAMLIMLLTLGVGQMWALSDGETWYEGNTPYLYFNNINSNYNGVSVVQGRQWGFGSNSAGSQGYAMTAISNTKLYYIHQSLYDHYTTQCFVDRNGGSGWTDWSSTAVASRVTTYAHNYTNSYNLTYTSDKVYVFTAASSSKNASLTKSVDAASGYSSLNKTITVKAKVSTDGGSTYSTATSPGSLSASSNKFTAYNSCASAQSLSSGTITCGYTATTTLTAADATGYTFRGWYDSSGTRQTASKTLTIYPTADATYYAYYEENRYSLTFSHNGHGSISVGGAAVSSGSTAKVNYFTTKTLVATPSTGYNFTGWTKSGTNTSAVTIGNASNASTTIKATNTGATVTAGFTAKTTTVTLNKNTPAGQMVSGDASVTATYDAALPDFIALTCTGGYSLTGYWSESSGGTRIINADGTFAANSGIWNREDGATLDVYAQWSADPGVSLSAAKTSSINVGETIRLTATGRNAANITRYEFYLGEDLAYTATTSSTTATYDYVVNTTGNKSFTVKMYYNSGSNNVTSSAEVLTLNTPTISLTSSKTTGINVGETITLTATASNLSPSATNKITYKFYEGSTLKATETVNSLTQTYSYTPTTTGNKTMKVTIDILEMATKTSSNVSLTLNTPSVSLAVKAGSPSNFYLGEGSTILKATPSNVGAGVTPSYVFTDQIAGGVTSASQTGTEWTYNPSVSGQAKARTMKVTMSVGGSTYTATVGVSVYEHFTVHIKNTDSWSGMYVYMWNASGNNGAFPGVRQELWNGSDLIYNVVLDTKYTNFIISQGNDDKKSGDISMLAVSNAGNCYTTTTGASLPTMTCPAVPSVTTTAASDILNTSATLGCNITNLNRDNASEYGYYYSTSSTLSSANATTVGTEVKIGGRKNATGNNAHSLTGLSANTTYYVIAYAKNCAGTGWGSKISFTTLSQTTVSFNTHGGSAVSNVTAVKTKAMPAISAPTRTGYTFNGMYDAASEGTQYYTSTGASARAWDKDDASFTLHAQWTPKTYSITLDQEGGASGSTSVTMTYDASTHTAITNPTKTGYTFGGYWTGDNGTGTLVIATDGTLQAGVSTYTGAGGIWIKDATCTLYAKWTAKTTTIKLDQTGAASAGSVTTRTGTYDADMPAITGSGSRPTAPQGYAFMGYYDALEPLGTKYYNADGTSAHTWDKEDASFTLHAYFKKAEITTLALSAGTVLPKGSVTTTPTIEPTPTGTHKICWKLLYNNGTEYSPQPTFTPESGNVVSFNAPEASGTYKVRAQLRTGSECGAGTLLSEQVASFVVAGTHTVTIQYKCGDVTVKSSTVVEGVKPLEWSEEITPDEIFGYSFEKWVAGDGVTMTINGGVTTIETGGETTGKATTHAVQIKAIYDGKLIAKYTKKNIIYFKNTLGWTNVYYHDSYWDNSKGGAGNKGQSHINQAMSLVPGTTNIYYWEGTPTSANVAFTNATYDNYQAFWSKSFEAKVVYPSNPTCASSGDSNYGYNAGTPMFVPVEQDGQDFNAKDGGKAIYYNKGYWRAYDPTTGESGSTGYTLKIYNQTEGNSSRELLQSIPFTNADASGQIFKATINLEAAKGYGIKVERDNSLMYTNTTGHLHQTGNVVAMSVNPDNYAAIWIKSTAAGDYDFIITCNGSGQLCLQATFPAAKNDYRVLYTDNATWSNGAHTLESWVHPSRVISAKAGATDTISFFISKDNSPKYKIQKVNAINESTGAITWTNVTSWTDISVGKTGVYNFIFNQPSAGSISLSKTEAYTGNYYIRTDNAGSTKWENYRAEDHKMTYSEYAAKITHTGEDWKDFTHYFMKYVDKDKESGKYKNVKFTVANDYSPCISDTLVQQAGDITPNHVNDAGELQANANIRFMWNSKNNKLQRAYLAAAQTDGSKFLVLQGQSGKLLAPDGTPLSDANGNNHRGGTDAIQFTDKEHWMYEAEVKAVPGGRVKLYATYHGGTFYYYGDNTASFTGTSAIDLVTGNGGEAQTIRVVYDFKTDRLIAAWVPSEETIENEKTVNADIMLIREHQGQGHQINLKGSGSIKTNKTVYGVLRFNRWTLNNKSTAAGHAVLPVGEQKSQYERFNYMISFPFDVQVGEIFGFGTIGRHYRIYYYDGLGRAKEGFFAERGDDNWRMIDDTDSILHANQGYLLQLNYIRMADNNTETWPQANMNEVELYFPAMNTINTISLADVTIPALGDAYNCKINLQPTYEAQGNPNAAEADRRVKDSYWRCIGVPGFTSYEATAGTWDNFNWKAETDNLPYLYEWQMDDNKLSVVSSATFTFKPMHAYLIQNGKSFKWESVAHPTIVAAPRRSAAEEGFYEFYLEMQNGEQALDHTYVRLTDKENITADFDFGQDLSKELNSGANIFTKVGYERLAANNLPLSEQTTIVPVGVKIAAEGNYTFAMPEGTHGIGVTLVDNETGDRTNLSLFDYSVNLTKGDYANRFILEISPVKQMPTDIENVQEDNVQGAKARKVMVDGILYIVKDGKVFDARGAKVK